MKTGLVLEGGAMRGLFTAGVLDVFMENNIKFDGAIGVSAGAVFGCNLKSHQIGRAIRYNKKYCKDPRYVSLKEWIKTGDLYSVEFDYDTLPNKLDLFDREAYKNDPTDFYIVATDCIEGKPVYELCNNGDEHDIQWMRASASMPVFSNPVPIDGGMYLDGGTSDSIPLKYFESIGYDRNVVILTQPFGYVKKPYPFMSYIRKKLKDYPEMIRVMENRYNIYNDTLRYIAEKEATGEILVIRPKEKIKAKPIISGPDVLQETYDMGVATGKEVLDKVREFIDVDGVRPQSR